MEWDGRGWNGKMGDGIEGYEKICNDMEWDGMERDGRGWNGMGSDRMKWKGGNGMGWNEMGWNGMGQGGQHFYRHTGMPLKYRYFLPLKRAVVPL
eukprot:gene21153-biopygen7175